MRAEIYEISYLLEVYWSIGNFLAIPKVSKDFVYNIGWNIL